MSDINKDSNIYESVCSLARDVSFGDVTGIHSIKGGANNRVYRIENAENKALLKVYFRHPSDPRDRLKTEYDFVTFAWRSGIRTLPRPMGFNNDEGIALYEWIEGRPMASQGTSGKWVRQAVDFLISLNEFRENAKDIKTASEACFSVQEHMDVVERRIDRLLHITAESEADVEAARFAGTELIGKWRKTSDNVVKRMGQMEWKMDEVLSLSERCLSPSDFGLHNAILTDSGVVKFIDFEYAGWDDPAKTVCDFFCQPKVPIPLSYYDLCVEAVLSMLPETKRHRERIKVLFPVYQIKWCCIMLNDFLKIDGERRIFAINNGDREDRKRLQLDKAVSALREVQIQ